MATSRRKFLEGLVFASGILVANASGIRAWSGTARDDESKSGARLPLLTNYNDDGSAILTEGKTVLIALAFAAPISDPQGSFPISIQPDSSGEEVLEEKQPLWFYLSPDRRTAHTFLTAPLDPVTGRTYPMRFTAHGGADAQGLWNYTIRLGKYRQTTLTLAREFTDPTPDIDAQKAGDFAQMVEVLKGRTPRQWSKPFILPTDRGDNDNYGVKRTVNGTKHYRHRGLDFHAALHTPVKAINDGTVVLDTEQWVAGQTICIDHGGGVFSKYAHLSERRVHVGDRITQGQIIALSGNSGGQKAPPHLHLDTIVNGTHVDPHDFMRTAARLVQLEGDTQPVRARRV